ncbi:MAG: hypothetical protein PF450_06480 [Bacteroidales bacterium]|jgi:hypothetical protein|nr:hypothetical protein [Bacteroidales bacterium]
MDFDIGTIFYIIVTIVVIVASTRKKKKKSGAAPSGTSGAESKVQGFLSKLGVQLEDFADNTKETVNTFAEEFVPGQSSSEPVFESDGEPYDQFLEEEAAENRRFSELESEYDPNSIDNLDLILSEDRRSTLDQEIQDVIELDDLSGFEYPELLNDFDLQTAVIYSTILNRKEY